MLKLTALSASLLLLVNVIVLAGVAYNRSDDKVAQVKLAERELSVYSSYSATDENSGMALKINWSTLSRNSDNKLVIRKWGNPDWLNEAKLKALGVDVDALKTSGSQYESDYRYNRSMQSLDVLFVLELDGDAYKKALEITASDLNDIQLKQNLIPKDKKLIKRVKDRQSKLTRLQKSDSRLFVIDAGNDKQALMTRYPDRNKYLLIRGELKPYLKKNRLTASIKRLFISTIHVPLPFSEVIDDLTQGKKFDKYGTEPIPPRYEVQLNVGKRLEPWIESVRGL